MSLGFYYLLLLSFLTPLWLVWGTHQGLHSVPCTPVYFTFDFALQSYAHSSSYRKPQLCKPASSCPSLSLPAHYTFPQALNPRPCMLSQVQENWAVCGEPFEFALCIRIPYCEVPQAHCRAAGLAVLFLSHSTVNTSIHFHWLSGQNRFQEWSTHQNSLLEQSVKGRKV